MNGAEPRLYGGQAVLEGVMMRGRRFMAVAVRAPSGEIVVRGEPLAGRAYTARWARWPLVRGVVLLWEQLALGTRSLVFSANVALAESADAARQVDLPARALWGTILVALAGATALFFVVPVLAMAYLDRFLGSAVLSNLVEKGLRLGLVLGYIGGIGLVPDIRRVFQYHGAEHKTINAYEAGAPLTVASVRAFPLEHPRCGTTFLLLVVLVSFLLFTLLGQPPLVERILSRVLLIPVVAGLAYEFIRWAARQYHRPLVRTVLAPGLLVQRLTTREPDDAQIAVAIAALRAVLAAEEPEALRRTAATVS